MCRTCTNVHTYLQDNSFNRLWLNTHTDRPSVMFLLGFPPKVSPFFCPELRSISVFSQKQNISAHLTLLWQLCSLHILSGRLLFGFLLFLRRGSLPPSVFSPSSSSAHLLLGCQTWREGELCLCSNKTRCPRGETKTVHSHSCTHGGSKTLQCRVSALTRGLTWHGGSSFDLRLKTQCNV